MHSDMQNEQSRPRSLVPTVIGFGLMVLVTIAAFFLIRSYGETLLAPTTAAAAHVARAALAHALVDAVFRGIFRPVVVDDRLECVRRPVGARA